MKGQWCPYFPSKFCQEEDCDNCVCNPRTWKPLVPTIQDIDDISKSLS